MTRLRRWWRLRGTETYVQYRQPPMPFLDDSWRITDVRFPAGHDRRYWVKVR